MKFNNDVVQAIGNTPLIKLKHASEMTGCTILGKAEFMNPGQSVKDRAALFIIRDALNTGKLQPGGTVVEGTAGNTGIGLALVGNALGLKTVIVIPETQSDEKKQMLRLAGAEPVDWPLRLDCCGASLTLPRPDVVQELSGRILTMAHDRGAHLLMVACPLCHSNLDFKQDATLRALGALGRVGEAILGGLLMTVKNFGTGYIVAGLLAVAFSYAACVALGTVYVRLGLARTGKDIL